MARKSVEDKNPIIWDLSSTAISGNWYGRLRAFTHVVGFLCIKFMTQEEKSIKYVINYEKSKGRNPVDVSIKHIGYDIKSGKRFIEVKSRPKSKIQPFIKLHNSLLRSIGKGLVNYYLYIVYDMDENPKLVIVPPEKILANLETEVSLLIRGKVYSKIKPEKLNK